jgi:hypothetical protein
MPSFTHSKSSRDLDLGPSASRLVETRAYLRALPNGLDSYPDHTQKASIYRTFVEATPLMGGAGGLPAAIARLLEAPLLPSTWVSETLSTSLFLAARDLLFSDDDSFVDHFRAVNRTVIASPMYRVLFALASPERLLTASGQRMAALHRGIVIESGLPRGKRTRLELSYPDHLVPRIIARCYATAFEVAAEAAGARDAFARIVRFEPRSCTFDITWV